MHNYAIIILAAGSSSRMGRPKQLLQVNGTTLLNHTIDEALKLPSVFVCVVTGAHADLISPHLNRPHLHICHNPDWESGMASSIQRGLQELKMKNLPVSGCIISVCDQPFISSAIFINLIAAHQNAPSHIIASSYQGTAGVPALFPAQYFPELMMLRGHEGAKKLLTLHADKLTNVPFPGGEIDLDTPADYDQLSGSMPPE
ncbi:MAG: nucleotidyltransferase family protein [Arcticibacter sp.]